MRFRVPEQPKVRLICIFKSASTENIKNKNATTKRQDNECVKSCKAKCKAACSMRLVREQRGSNVTTKNGPGGFWLDGERKQKSFHQKSRKKEAEPKDEEIIEFHREHLGI